MESFGKMIAPDTLRFERRLRGPIEKVWAYLTESEKRGKWLAKGEMELVAGGKLTLSFLHSELSPEAGGPPAKFKAIESGHSFTGTIRSRHPQQRSERLAYASGDPDLERRWLDTPQFLAEMGGGRTAI